MKTFRSATKFIGLGSLLALVFCFTASLAFAGPGPHFWSKPTPATTAKQTDTVKPGAPAKMVCPVCKTVPLIGAIDTTRPNLGGDWARPRTPEAGFKHTCGHCGGVLTAMRGKMTNAMQGNCAMCGKDAERCVAAQHPAMTA